MPEKFSSSSAKAARSNMLEVKQEPQTMAHKKKRKSEERSPPKVPPKKSKSEMPKKKKHTDKPARGNVSFAISGKGPQKRISAAPTRAERFQHEGSSAGAMEEQQVVVLGVLRVCFFVTSRRHHALCCACCAPCASYVSCLRVAFGGETSRCSRFAEAVHRRLKGRRPNKGPRRPQKALHKALPHVRSSQQGAMVVEQVSRCALWCHCRLRVMPVWYCCACGIRPGMCCTFCTCYTLHVSRFWPSSGGQHPVFRVLQTPVRVKEEPPDSLERRAEPEGAPDTETAAEGKMTDGEIQEL